MAGGRGLTATQNSLRPNTCCFCWCCCCSCSWRGEEQRRRRRISQDTKMELVPNYETCTKPSVDEIQMWSQSFEKLMKNPAGRNVFREFLRTEYSEENMMFWLACEDLKQEVNKSAVEDKVQSIYEEYIAILSPREVSLDAHVHEVINLRMEDPAAHTFDDAQLQIYTLMHRDSYPRFLCSNIYRSLLHTAPQS
ncbi:regulator of G-protein signaling 19 isoform X1 [Gouania willdenowi]|uniref:Regulator of G-protein signaling 20-like n=1 Tax=Gouania willdenowi TaxID=441366 RepID=A0A8C5GLP7_GOUWI|nr:regulator of G-protein signaling 19-like isoform X1 [Gouania willdenowi]